MPTPEQQTLIEAIASALADNPDIEAAWLSGSLGRGGGDQFSDVDILALAADGRADAASARWVAEGVGRIAEPVLVNKLFGGRIVNVVTATWERFDVVFVQGAELARYDGGQLTPLFNRTGVEPPRAAQVAYQPSPGAVTALVEEFLRVLGLGPVGIGREEYVVCLSGVELLRKMTVDMMLEANRVSLAERGGALKRNPFLTDGQRAALEGLAPVAANRESLMAANTALARLFLPCARQVAAEVGATWPAALEAATKRRLVGYFGEGGWPENLPDAEQNRP
jgi:predicted nucleotidyltransferase